MDMQTYQPSRAVAEMLRAARRDAQLDQNNQYFKGRLDAAKHLIGFAVMYEINPDTLFDFEAFDAWYAEQLAA